ncbi:hypothetical protein HDV57DRAFT_405240 [Trichoderma longibrachiatum]
MMLRYLGTSICALADADKLHAGTAFFLQALRHNTTTHPTLGRQIPHSARSSNSNSHSSLQNRQPHTTFSWTAIVESLIYPRIVVAIFGGGAMHARDTTSSIPAISCH